MEQAVTSNLVFPYVGEQIPKSYDELRQWIEHNAEKFNYRITLYTLYNKAYRVCHFKSRESFDNAVQYLEDMHHIKIINTHDSNSGGKLIIMNTQWLVDVTKVLALPPDRNTEPTRIARLIRRKCKEYGKNFVPADEERFKQDLRELNENGHLTRILAEWLWITVDIADKKDVDLLLNTLKVQKYLSVVCNY